MDDLGYTDDGIRHVTARFGYMETPTYRPCCAWPTRAGLETPLEVDRAYFLSTIDLRSDEPGMAHWRKRLFVATSTITTDAAEYFGLPRDATIIMGSRISV